MTNNSSFFSEIDNPENSDGIAVYKDGQMEYFSPGYKEVLGFNGEDIKKITVPKLNALVHPDDMDYVQTIVESEYLRKRGYLSYQFRIRRKNGEYIWMENNSSFFYNRYGDHEYSYIRSKVLDHRTDDKRNDNSIFHEITENMENGLFMLYVQRDNERRIHYYFSFANQSFKDAFSKRKEDVIGRRFESVVDWPGVRQIINHYYDCCVLSECAVTHQVHKERFGEIRLFNVTLKPLKNMKGEVDRIIGICSDITESEKLRMEKNINDLKKVKQYNMPERDEFLSHLSTEIRNLLSAYRSSPRDDESQSGTSIINRFKELLNDIESHKRKFESKENNGSDAERNIHFKFGSFQKKRTSKQNSNRMITFFHPRYLDIK